MKSSRPNDNEDKQIEITLIPNDDTLSFFNDFKKSLQYFNFVVKGINVVAVVVYFYEVYNITSYIEKDNYQICKQ